MTDHQYSLPDLLAALQAHGSSVMLTWADGEDSDMWECSWITGGVRFTAYSEDPALAVIEARDRAHRAFRP